jgi:dTDP-4-dehydrorhamnose 3,5-epimerase-like enzyme
MKLQNKIKIYERKKISDSRGWFLKVIDGQELKLPDFTGEIYLISANPGKCRANHYHIEANEWFTLVKGKAKMIIEDIITKERVEINLDSENPKTVYVPCNIAHAFRNTVSEPYLLVTYTDKLFDPVDTVNYQLCRD